MHSAFLNSVPNIYRNDGKKLILINLEFEQTRSSFCSSPLTTFFFLFNDINKTFDVDLHKILHNLYQILFNPPIKFSFVLAHPLLQWIVTVRAARSWHLVFPSKLPDTVGWHREQLKCSSTVGASLCHRAPLIPLAPQCQSFTPVLPTGL